MMSDDELLAITDPAILRAMLRESMREIDRLRADAARLDWLESRGSVYGPWVDYECEHAFEWYATPYLPDAPRVSLRAAIDAARAPDSSQSRAVDRNAERIAAMGGTYGEVAHD